MENNPAAPSLGPVASGIDRRANFRGSRYPGDFRAPLPPARGMCAPAATGFSSPPGIRGGGTSLEVRAARRALPPRGWVAPGAGRSFRQISRSGAILQNFYQTGSQICKPELMVYFYWREAILVTDCPVPCVS